MNHEISIEITDGKRAKKSEKQDELPLQMGNGGDQRRPPHRPQPRRRSRNAVDRRRPRAARRRRTEPRSMPELIPRTPH